MARGGLYKSDIAKARRAVLAEGKHPSVDAIRVALGNTGSKTTIHRHLKEIEAEEGQGPGAKVAVSDALQDLVSRLAARLHEEAEAIIAEAKEQSDAALQTKASLLALRTKEASELGDQVQRTETTLAAERAAHQQAAGQLQQARVQVAQLEERAAGQERRSREQDAHLQSLEEKHQHVRDALEHFRSAAQEQRSREQRQHEQALQALQVELRHTADQLTGKQSELVQLNRDNGRLTEQVGHLQAALRCAERERDQAARERDALRPLPAQLAALESRAAQAMVQADSGREQVALLESQLSTTLAELHAAELDRARSAAKLEGMQAALAQRSEEAQASATSRKRRARGQPEASTTAELPLGGQR